MNVSATTRGILRDAPVGHVDANDAGLQQFSVLVCAGCQQPALVVGQTVANKQDVVFLGRFAKSLTEFRLLVFHRSQDEGRRVETDALGPLRGHNNTRSDSLTRHHSIFSSHSYLRALQSHVDGETGAEARQSLEVGGVGQRPPTLSEHGEGQRLEVLAVEVALPAAHRLQEILAGNNLGREGRNSL